MRRLAPANTPTGCATATTYHRRHGIRYFHGCYDVSQDRLWGVLQEHKGGIHTLAALKSIRAARPDGAPIYVIEDNLSCNTTPAIRTWAAAHKVELCLTPTNASWADPVQAQFGPLRMFTMANSDDANHIALARDLHAYLRWRNANARHPDVLAAQRRERPASAANTIAAGAALNHAPPDRDGDPARSAHSDDRFGTSRLARRGAGEQFGSQ